MTKYIDISLPVSPHLTRWPGSPVIRFERNLNLDQGDVANDTTIELSVHTGTHVDAPSHFLQGGETVESLPLDTLIGKTTVVDIGESEVITPEILDSLNLPRQTTRLLFRTRNSQLWQQQVKEFQPDFVALSADAAQWIVDRGIRLVGIDYLSIQRYYDGPETHQILLQAKVIIIEGLNLAQVTPGEYQLICLPIKLKGVEGAPARVILIK
jgi:arylformamidase